MFRRIPLKSALFTALLSLSVQAFGREMKDVTGTTVKLADEPVRVVTLMPSLGELAADLLSEKLDRIVGVSEYTDYPPALTKAKSVGAYTRVNLEVVAGLKPDLILASRDGNAKDQVDHLREIGLPVVVVDTGSFAQAEESMRLTGEALGVAARGQSMAKQLSEGIERFRARTAERLKSGNKRRVLVQLDSNPLITVGGKTFIGEALDTVGAENVYAEQGARYPKPALEDALHRAPDTILVMALGTDMRPFQAMAAAWSQFPSLPAVKEHRVKVLRSDPIVRPTLRLLEGLGLLERAIYGKP